MVRCTSRRGCCGVPMRVCSGRPPAKNIHTKPTANATQCRWMCALTSTGASLSMSEGQSTLPSANRSRSSAAMSRSMQAVLVSTCTRNNLLSPLELPSSACRYGINCMGHHARFRLWVGFRCGGGHAAVRRLRMGAHAHKLAILWSVRRTLCGWMHAVRNRTTWTSWRQLIGPTPVEY